MPTEPVMIIARGDLPSLTAAMIQSDPGRLILWHVRESDVAARRRGEAVRACGELLGVRRVVETEAPRLGMPGMEFPEGLRQSQMLLHAIIVARQLQCGKIVWPVCVGPDHRRVGEMVERAGLAAATSELPSARGAGAVAGAGSVMIDLPLVDLTDRKLVEVADDCAGPLGAFWPCEGDAEEPCGRCPQCRRWAEAFAEAGVGWPWAVKAAV